MSKQPVKIVGPGNPLGQEALKLLGKSPESLDVVELQREAQKKTQSELEDIIAKHKDYAEQYYIVLIYRRERLLCNVMRQQFVVRKSAPRPNYDTTLFSYNNKTCELKHHWTIPDEGTCEYLLAHEKELPEEEKPLLTFVKKFADGAL